jgi:hypothetical protein
MSIKDVAEYLTGPFTNINGWCIPQLWQCIQPLALLIEEAGAKGPVAEIGVFHGKFFIGLVKTMGAETHNTAIDVFDLQEYNLDKAGEGNKEKLIQNMAAAKVPEDAVSMIRADSMWLTSRDANALFANTGGFSLFSVDGCHLPEHTVNDMLFAMVATRPEGIIFIDDYYNANWPGVQEGVAKFYLNNSAKFVPLLFTCNKLFLCNISFHAKYLDSVIGFVRQNFKSSRIKRVRRFGFDTVTITPDFKDLVYVVPSVTKLS